MFRSILFALFVLQSCSRSEPPPPPSKLAVPADEATPEERAVLDQTIAAIEKKAADLGQPRSFHDLPVVLTTDDRTYTDHPAACVSVGNEGQFILVKRSVLDAEKELAEAGVESSVFRVLLHEIGHCYFHRQHEEDRLAADGRTIRLALRRNGEDAPLDYPMLDATVMVPETPTLPVALEKYYVAEILGLARAKRVEDLAAYAPVKLINNL